MVLSPPLEAISRTATQDFPNILLNPEVHYSVQNSPPLLPILMNQDHIILSYFS